MEGDSASVTVAFNGCRSSVDGGLRAGGRFVLFHLEGGIGDRDARSRCAAAVWRGRHRVRGLAAKVEPAAFAWPRAGRVVDLATR